MKTSNLRNGTPVMLRDGDNARLMSDISNRSFNVYAVLDGKQGASVINSYDIIGYMNNVGDWKANMEYSKAEQSLIKVFDNSKPFQRKPVKKWMK